MKVIIVACVLSVIALSKARPEEKYTDKYDNIDVDEILSNKRTVESYVKCMLDQGKCTQEGKEIKENLIEALENDCAKCTEVQNKQSRRIVAHLLNNEPAFWDQLTAKFDADKKYEKKYEKELKSYKA